MTLRASSLFLLALYPVSSARAEEPTDRGEATVGLRIFAQPAPSDWLVVVTPSVSGRARATPWLQFDASWNADVVTGATRRIYGSPDVVSAATRFQDFRNVIDVGAQAQLGPVLLTGGYAYGTENDYHSNLLRVGARVDLANHNTILAGSYSHGFDRICDLAQPGVSILLRQPLDTSRGCFTGNPMLTEESLDIDSAEASVAQTFTPALIATLVGSYQHLGGFQSNPYRTVRLLGGRFQAQESHPRVRDRGAITLRVRYAIERWRATVGGDLRLYRDTWGVQSLTAELSWEQPFHPATPTWRFGGRARGYVQSGATFFRDVGESNSYEIAGPAGNFFTADQALAPLADLIIGGHVSYVADRPADKRVWRAFTNMTTTLLLEYVRGFALSPEPPNAARLRGFATALVLGLSATGRF
jgi:hypothetical protein